MRRLGLYGILGLGISVLLLAYQAQAAQVVLLQSRDLRLAVPLAELQTFAAGGTPSPALQRFWQQTEQDPAQVKQWLTTAIAPPRAARLIAPEFLLLQLNKTVGDPLGRENLAPLRTALRRSLKRDNAFSLLEVMQNYPAGQVRLEVSRLEHVYRDVNLLVTRIEPILQATKDLLPELLCDCEGNLQPRGEDSKAIAHTPYHSLLSGETAVLPKSAASTADAMLLAQLPSTAPELANKALQFQFGPFARNIPLPALTNFAETGALSRGWRSLFRIARVDPELVRTGLNEQVSVNQRTLDRLLNNLLGEYLLFQIGQIVHTPSSVANLQAMRSALVLAAADGQISVLEIIQQYPTRQLVVNGLQIARLGQSFSRFQSAGGVRRTVVDLEEWLLQLQASQAKLVCNCAQLTGHSSQPVSPTITKEAIAKYLPPNWQPVEPHREDRGIIKVIFMRGTPYEMGFQHGQYLHDEIASLGTDFLGLLRFAGKGLALGRLAANRSFPEVVEECRGLTAATADIGMTLDACLVLAYGDVFQEVFGNTLPNVLFWDGCSQWVATGDATVDGRLYHGSTLDNGGSPINFIVNNPVVFIRQPNDGLPHVFIAYPGVVWPNWGFNVAGISLGLDSLHPRNADELFIDGFSEVQIMRKVLKTATTFEDARKIMKGLPSVRANLVMVADSRAKKAGVFEIVGKHVGVRELQDNGVLYVTNHIEPGEMFERQRFPLSESSLLRFKRFGQLMEPNGVSTLYGKIDPAAMAKIGRDRTHPVTMQPSPFDVFDDDASPGGNGSLRQGIYDADKLLLWVAAGSPPVPENPFVCFSIGEMLKFPNAAPCEKPAL